MGNNPFGFGCEISAPSLLSKSSEMASHNPFASKLTFDNSLSVNRVLDSFSIFFIFRHLKKRVYYCTVP